LEAGHFLGVAHEDFAVCDCWMIPGFAFDGLEAGEFFITFWSRFVEGELAVATEND
jgi:hypothetical protein